MPCRPSSALLRRKLPRTSELPSLVIYPLPFVAFCNTKASVYIEGVIAMSSSQSAADMASSYPRDMRGYGREPPAAQWPENAAVCVQFVVNYEEGGENNILHGDAGSEAFLSEIVGAASWPGQRHWNMESIYEYGAKAGFWRLWRMFTSRSLPVTVYGVATALARSPEQVAAMKEASAGFGALQFPLQTSNSLFPHPPSTSSGELGNSQSRIEVDRAQRHDLRRGEGADGGVRAAAHGDCRRAADGLVHWALFHEHPPPLLRAARA